ncbi:hypothetical protein HY745_04570 [Candidatus Desantisbacteria bacterium]|nr:hypothetical protein [Candidatus Desantisbacteria bacterium]
MYTSLRVIKTTNVLVVCLLLFMSLFSCGRESEKEKDASTSMRTDVPIVKPWKVVGNQGVAVFVYVESEKSHDGVLMAQILQVVIGQKNTITKPVQIMFFDKESETPVAFPMTDSQMIHQVAQYNYNPNNSFEEFVWLTVTDSTTSPPNIATKKDNISPGIAP